ncbi:selenocysteine-specific elongation factor isoform X1 [Falco biarmicus]|uniref:selenocysteine-specific elongation factor isoform X1 n=1 Tax=Falco cherrug TaxID=345164 RepID=UPI002479698B|nr:selenocysteine-specific elongation factor isoform X1 [Falco cherrug]XP_056192781.1 selenocysteine-specific elongation factor isoform X1 [Falco biarmicus]
MAAGPAAPRVLNVNVGVLGHIDSGKTALARALSTTGSTAAFDRAPQSRARGITLDLGFSCLRTALPPQLGPGPGELQFTLVDCPGHASLIRTIIGGKGGSGGGRPCPPRGPGGGEASGGAPTLGELPASPGAQIIDLMMLVIDVTKGMQTQSAECLVIGQIACQKMVVVLNKIDLLPEGKRQSAIEKMTKKMQKTLENTKFCGCPVVAVAAKPGGPEAPESENPLGVSELIEVLKSQAYLPSRDPSGNFLMAVDHCFSIKGQGTVMTGTVLSGSVSLGDNVEIPALKVTKKVKSMQMFHTPVTYAMQGDRVGICVTQFDPKLLERGLICTPESLHTIHAAIISLKKIQYFRGALQTKAKFHITVGHETVMGRVMFFSPAPADFNKEIQEKVFDFEKDYLYQEEYLSKDSNSSEENKENDQSEVQLPRQQWALLEFEKPVTCPKLCLVIGSKLDTDIHANTCRLAFHGVLLQGMEDKNYMETFLPKLKVYKLKHKEGQVERVMDDYSVIGRSLFKKETNIQIFVGLKVKLSTGEDGIIDGGFGQSGKFKIRIPDGLKPDTKMLLTVASKKKSKAGKGDTIKEDESSKNDSAQPVTISLLFKRYVFDTQKKMIQS